jgi:hypothetical protein
VERHKNQPRSARPLPADLFAVELSLSHRRAWSAEPDEELETWHVSADAYDEDGSGVVSHVGNMRFVIVDLYEAGNPYGLLVGESPQLSEIAKVVFDRETGDLVEDLEEQLEAFGDRVLIVDRVRLEPEWRGFGIGALLTASAIKMLSGGVRAVICNPAPIDDPDSAAPGHDQPLHSKQVQALGEACARIGFEHFRDGVWTLDLNLVTFEESLARLRAQAQRYDRD